jgi:hypothetical protein
MKLFDKKGMMVIPNPIKDKTVSAPKVLIINELYCPNGHNLINNRTSFNSYPGILIKVEQAGQIGMIALSPIYGDKCRITLDIDLKSGETIKMFCPHCDVALPVHSKCSCGADLITLFLTKEPRFADCVVICNRVDCANSSIIEGGDIISASMMKIL